MIYSLVAITSLVVVMATNFLSKVTESEKTHVTVPRAYAPTVVSVGLWHRSNKGEQLGLKESKFRGQRPYERMCRKRKTNISQTFESFRRERDSDGEDW